MKFKLLYVRRAQYWSQTDQARERKVSFDATLREEGSFCDAAVGPGRASAD